MFRILLLAISISAISHTNLRGSETPYVIGELPFNSEDWHYLLSQSSVLQQKKEQCLEKKATPQENSCWSFLEWICIPHKKSGYLTEQ